MLANSTSLPLTIALGHDRDRRTDTDGSPSGAVLADSQALLAMEPVDAVFPAQQDEQMPTAQKRRGGASPNLRNRARSAVLEGRRERYRFILRS